MGEGKKGEGKKQADQRDYLTENARTVLFCPPGGRQH